VQETADSGSLRFSHNIDSSLVNNLVEGGATFFGDDSDQVDDGVTPIH
jgi:hypothetical protein